LQALIAGEWETVDAAPTAATAAASGLVAAYAQWHLERGIRALEHVTASDRHTPFERLGSTEGLGSSQRPTPSQRQGSR
jgi:hypothetical protein